MGGESVSAKQGGDTPRRLLGSDSEGRTVSGERGEQVNGELGFKGLRLVWRRYKATVHGRLLNVPIEILGTLCLGRVYGLQLVRLVSDPQGANDANAGT